MTRPRLVRHVTALLASAAVSSVAPGAWAQPSAARAGPPPVIVSPSVALAPATANPSSQVVGTNVMGAAAAPAPLSLQLLRPSPFARFDPAAGVLLEGRTAPNALVRARVDAVPPAAPGRASVALLLMEETVQADAAGHFRVSVGPHRAAAGTRYEIGVRATQGAQSTPEQRVVVMPAQG